MKYIGQLLLTHFIAGETEIPNHWAVQSEQEPHLLTLHFALSLILVAVDLQTCLFSEEWSMEYASVLSVSEKISIIFVFT